MFDGVIRFFQELPGGRAKPEPRDGDDPRVAAAALMFHVMDADGVRASTEREQLEKMLTETYALSGEDLTALVKAGDAANREAIDLYAFTRVLKRHLDIAARSNFIRLLWEIVYADGERHELEDNVVWRVAELIGVERAERVALRRSVAAAAGLGDGA